ncbi:unnamed protein product, partial [Mesorhabditis belari]|uniref:LRAT domain-containing protein n=1 Tax=Mesorhabditis belari TaxID=2138241 RepID=A0AAF3F2U3_9BILA
MPSTSLALDLDMTREMESLTGDLLKHNTLPHFMDSIYKIEPIQQKRKFLSTFLYFAFIAFGAYILLPGFFRSSSNGFKGGHAVATSKKTQFMTPSELRSVAEPGDTNLFKRFGYLHAAIIRRNDEYGFDVVHVDGSKVGPEERVIESPVSVIAGVGSLVCIDNALDSVLTPADRQIMKRLDHAVGTIFTYHMVDNNCEHFASLMRYGCPLSPQIETTFDYTRKVLYKA